MQGMMQGMAAAARCRVRVRWLQARTWQLAALMALLLAMSGFAVAQEIPPPPAERQGNVTYLLRPGSAQILRYDLAQRQWLAPIAIDAQPSAFVTTPSHLYIAYGRRIERRTLAGSGATHVLNTAGDVTQLLVDGSVVFAMHRSGNGGAVTAISVGTLARIDQFESYSGLGPAVVDRNRRFLYSLRDASWSSQVSRLDYDVSGMFGDNLSGPYDGGSDPSRRLWLYPAGDRLVTSSGNILHAENLQVASTFDRAVTDIVFIGADVPVALHDDRLTAYDQAMHATGSRVLLRTAQAIMLHDDRIVAFADDASATNGVSVEEVALSALSPATPGASVSPLGLAYTIDDIAIDDGGIAYLLSNANRSVFRWDIGAQRYLSTLALAGPAFDIEYSLELDRLYVLGAAGLGQGTPQVIDAFELASAVPARTAHASLADSASGLIAVERELLVERDYYSGAVVLSAAGQQLGPVGYCCSANYHFFDAPRRQLYFNSTRMRYQGNGVFTVPTSWGYGSLEPLDISHDGRWLVDRGGLIYDAASATETDALSNDVVNAQWTAANRLYTIRPPENLGSTWEPEYAAETRVQRWGTRYALEREVTVAGTYVQMQSHGNRLLVVTYLQDQPSFTLLDADLQIVAPATLAAPRLVLDGYTAIAVALRWADVAGEQSYVVERQDPGSNAWRVVATLPANRLEHVDLSLDEAGVHRYRVSARNAGLSSPPSNELVVDLAGNDGSGALPGSTPFVADDVALAADGRVYLLSRAHEQLFVWSTRHQRWEASIALLGAPHAMAYGEATEALYLQYDDGGVTALNLRADAPAEVAFLDGGVPCGILAVDTGLLLCAESAWYGAVLTSLDSVGRTLGSRQNYGQLHGAAWNDATRTVFFPADSGSQRVYTMRLLPDGSVDPQFGSELYFAGAIGTLHVSPDAGSIIVGRRREYAFVDGTFTEVGLLPVYVDDALWRDGALFTGEATTLSRHDGAGGATPVANLTHPVDSLFLLRDGRVLVVMVQDDTSMRFALYERDFARVPEAVLSDGFE